MAEEPRKKRTKRRKANDPYDDYILIGHDAAQSEGPAARVLSTFTLYGPEDGPVSTEYLLQREKTEFIKDQDDRARYVANLERAWKSNRNSKESRELGANANIEEHDWVEEREDIMLALLLHREAHDSSFRQALTRTGTCALLQKGRGEWGMAFVGGKAVGENLYGKVLEGIRASMPTNE